MASGNNSRATKIPNSTHTKRNDIGGSELLDWVIEYFRATGNVTVPLDLGFGEIETRSCFCNDIL